MRDRKTTRRDSAGAATAPVAVLGVLVLACALCALAAFPVQQAENLKAEQKEQKPELVDGAALFAAHCMLCHGPGARASQVDALARLPVKTLYGSMTTGVMKEQSEGLSDVERRAIAEYLSRAGGQIPEGVSVKPCSGPISKSAGGAWNGWSPDVTNNRFQTAAAAGLTAQQVPSLRLKWALVFPGLATAANQPTVSAGRLYIGSWDGTVYALDAQRGCSYWVHKAESGVRVPVVLAGGAALFGDFLANVYAVDAASGKLRWRRRVDEHGQARITGALLAHDGKVFVPVASLEEGVAADPKYACCTFRGSVVALDIATGQEIWKTYTVPDQPKKLGETKVGTPKLGPSGVAVWSAPTLDPKRGLLYVATGNNYSEADSPTADAVIAMEMGTGKVRWVRQTRPSDRWNAACLFDPERNNCPAGNGPDYDYGANPVLARLSSGRELLLAGQKSGVLYALDPDRKGEIAWETRVGKGGNLGGIEWGMAADAKRAYVAISDWNVGTTVAEGTMNAVDLVTGKLLWTTPNPPQTCRGRRNPCSIANAAPVTAMPGIVFAGSLDGRLRAYDAKNGHIVWEFDTDTEFTDVQGRKGRGGSVNAAGTTVVNGNVYQTSGYGAFGLGMPGNVLLVFSAARK